MITNCHARFSSVFPFLFILILFVFTSACTNDDRNNSAFIEMNNPAQVFQSHTRARSAHLENIDSLIIGVQSITGRTISETETINAGSTLRLSVPSNIPLIITGNAFSGESLAYSGEVTIKAIRGGASANLTLLLRSLTDEDNAIQIDTPLVSTGTSKPSTGKAFSRNGDYVLFISEDENLVSNDSNLSSDVFLKNISTGTTINLHSSISGIAGESSGEPAPVNEADISADGLYVVFSSFADNLTINDTRGSQNIFLKNTLTDEIKMLSIQLGAGSFGESSSNPQISDDGTIITFYSKAFITEDVSNSIFLYDRINNQIQALLIDDLSENYKLSGDGSIIVYQSSNGEGLKIVSITGEQVNDNGGLNEIEGNLVPTARALIQNTPLVINSADINYDFSVSQDGRFTLFVPDISINNLLADQHHLFDVDSLETSLVSRNRVNQPFSGEFIRHPNPALSDDGRYVAFSYNGITYVRSVPTDNLAEIESGISPFLSDSGDKIGYIQNENLFVTDNPLYVAETNPGQKPVTPASLIFQETDGGFDLSWGESTDAAFFRVYQSDEPNISTRLRSSSGNLDIIESSGTSTSFTPFMYPFRDFYFVVVAVNQNGESVPSNEVTYRDPNIKTGIGSDSNPVLINLPYEGGTNDDMSFYKFRIPAPEVGNEDYTLSVIKKEDAGTLELTLSDLKSGAVYPCDSLLGQCSISNISEATELKLVVDGSNQTRLFYDITLSLADSAPDTLTLTTSLDKEIKEYASTTNPIALYFSETVMTESIIPSISLLNSNSVPVEFILPDNTPDFTNSALIQPLEPLTDNEQYTLSINTSLKAVLGSNLAQAYSKNFTARQFYNEGSVDAPINIGYTEFPYNGTIGGGTSYYKFSIPPITNKVYALQISDPSGLDINLTHETGSFDIDCVSVFGTCIIFNITEASDLTLTLNGDMGEGGFTQKNFTVSLNTIQLVNGLNSSSITFSRAHGAGLVLVNGVDPSYDYHLSDTSTYLGSYLDYQIQPLALSDSGFPQPIPPTCRVIFADGEQRDCPLTPDATGNILLQFPNLSGVSSNYVQEFRLDKMVQLSYDANVTLNEINLTDERIALFTGLEPTTSYAISLELLAGEIEYDVTNRLFKDSFNPTRHCSDRLVSTTNDLDGCPFLPNPNGEIVVHAEHLGASSSAIPSLKLSLTPILNDVDLSSNTTLITPTKRLLYTKLGTGDSVNNSWYSIVLEQPSLSNFEIKMYDDLESEYQCRSTGTDGAASCEINYSATHLIALEFPADGINGISSSLSWALLPTATAGTSEIIIPPAYWSLDLSESIGPSLLVEATLTNLPTLSSSVNMQVFRGDWRMEVCSPVRVGNNIVCITNYSGVVNKLDVKLYDHITYFDDATIPSFDVNLFDMTPTKLADGDSVMNTTSTLSNYIIYEYDSLLTTEDYIVKLEVTDNLVTEIFNFTMVGTASTTTVCESSTNASNARLQTCNSKVPHPNGFIIIDTSNLPGDTPFTLSIESTNPPLPL